MFTPSDYILLQGRIFFKKLMLGFQHFLCYDHCIVLAELCRHFYGKRCIVFASLIPINNVMCFPFL
jgi:hypothetical protein